MTVTERRGCSPTPRSLRGRSRHPERTVRLRGQDGAARQSKPRRFLTLLPVPDPPRVRPRSALAGALVPAFGVPMPCPPLLLAASRRQRRLHSLAACVIHFTALYTFMIFFFFYFSGSFEFFAVRGPGGQGRCVWSVRGNEVLTFK